MDLSLGISGPLAGVLVHLLGYSPIFLFTAAMAAWSMRILITLSLTRAVLPTAANALSPPLFSRQDRLV